MMSSVDLSSLVGPVAAPGMNGAGAYQQGVSASALAPVFSGYLTRALCQGVVASHQRLAADSPLSLSSSLSLVEQLAPYLSAAAIKTGVVAFSDRQDRPGDGT